MVQVEVWFRWSVDHHRWSLVGLDGINEIILATVHRWLERVHVGGASVGHLFCPWFFGGGVQLLSSTRASFFRIAKLKKRRCSLIVGIDFDWVAGGGAGGQFEESPNVNGT